MSDTTLKDLLKASLQRRELPTRSQGMLLRFTVNFNIIFRSFELWLEELGDGRRDQEEALGGTIYIHSPELLFYSRIACLPASPMVDF